MLLLCVVVECCVWLFGCLVVWLFGCLVGWLVVCLFVCLFVCSFVCVWCVFGVRCVFGVWHAENRRVQIPTRLRVSNQNVPVCTGNTSTCFKHLDVLLVHRHTEAYWDPHAASFRVPHHTHTPHTPTKMAHAEFSLGPRGSPKKPLDLAHFQFENKTRTTCSRFLQSFALPDEAVQLQLS